MRLLSTTLTYKTLMKLFPFVLIAWCFPLSINAQVDADRFVPISKVPLTKVLDVKPFVRIIKPTAILKTNAEFRGLPDTLARYVIRTAATLLEQDLYELYQQGSLSQKQWLAYKPQLDTARISKKPIRHAINAVVGLTRTGKKVVIVDQNNNQDFSDDSVLTYTPTLKIARKNGQYLSSVQSIVDTLPMIKVQTEVFDKGHAKAVTWLIKPNPYNRVMAYSDTTMADLHVEFQSCTHQEGKLLTAQNAYRFAVSNASLSPIYRPADVEVKLAIGSEDFPVDSDKNPSYQIGQTLDLGQQTYKLLGISYLGDTLYLSPLESAGHTVGTRINQFAPSFHLIDLSGKSIHSTALRGSYIILDFWGSWCVPCIELIPELKAFAQQYKGHKNVKLISIAREDSDQLAALKRLITKYAMSWPQVAEIPSTDKSNTITPKYQVDAFPTTLLLGPNGKILHRGSGRASFEELKSILNRELSESKN